MIKAILFDFWGTLIDNGTYSPMRQTYKILRPRMRFGDFVEKFEEVFMTQSFESQEEAFEKAIEHIGLQPKKFIIDHLIGLWNKNRLLATAYDDTFEVLEQLGKKYKVAIVSNTDCFVDAVLDKFDMAQKVDLILMSFQTGKLKQRDLFSHALTELGVSAHETVMVGDSLQTDIMGAEKAGIKAVLIDRKDRREHHTKIRKLSELFEVLDE